MEELTNADLQGLGVLDIWELRWPLSRRDDHVEDGTRKSDQESTK
jgi:hypothetical protein